MKNPYLFLGGLIVLALTAGWYQNQDSRTEGSNSPISSVTDRPELPLPAAHSVLEPELPPELTATAVPDGIPGVVPAPASRPNPEAAKLQSAPLVESYPQSMPPPRRVSDVIPEAAPDFDKIFIMFRNFRTLTGENPTGTNAEIMASILGGNPKGATLGPPEGQEINANGELIDRWGTPYFFHQLSRDRMEIRSAGPDRRLWNEDDLIGD